MKEGIRKEWAEKRDEMVIWNRSVCGGWGGGTDQVQEDSNGNADKKERQGRIRFC